MGFNKREYNKNYSKERRYFFKEHGMCTLCGKEKAEKNKTICYFCSCKLSDKYYEKLQCYTDEEKKQKKIQRNETDRKLYNTRKENGLCTRCGRKVYNKKILCGICASKQSEREKSKRRNNNIIPFEFRGNGIYCMVCCGIVEKKGQKVCHTCYEKLCANLKKARKNVSKDTYFRKTMTIYYVKKESEEKNA